MYDEVQKITVGELKVGLVGLDEVFQEVREKHISNATNLKQRLLDEVKKRNYVPSSMEKKLEAALLREYKEFLGEEVEENGTSGLEIRVLGPSCRACDKVYRDTKTVLAELGKAADLEHIKDLREIGRYGMMATPALIVNGKVKLSGKIPAKKQLKKWLEEA